VTGAPVGHEVVTAPSVRRQRPPPTAAATTSRSVTHACVTTLWVHGDCVGGGIDPGKKLR